MFEKERKKYAFNMVDYYLSKFEERLRTPYAFDIFKQKNPLWRYISAYLHKGFPIV